MTMRKQFLGWALLAGGLLAGSTACGLAVTAVMKPRPDPTVGWWPQPAGATVRYDLISRPPTTFGPAESPAAWDATELRKPLALVSESRELTAFDPTRMAEEEVALGFYKLAGTQPTAGAIDAAGDQIRADLGTLLTERPDTFPAGKVELLRVRWSSSRQEAQVLAKHTATKDGRTTVRFARWWLARTGAGWRAYDFDFPDTHLRLLDVRDHLVNRDRAGELPPGADGPANENWFPDYLQAVHWMSLSSAANDPASVRAHASAFRVGQPKGIPALQAAHCVLMCRLAALQGDSRRASFFADFARQQAPDWPAGELAVAAARNGRKEYAAALTSVKAYRDLVGDNPEAYREEAKAANDPKAAVAVLRKGLTVFPGDRALLLDLARRVPTDEREAVGELAGKTGTAEVLLAAAELYEPQFPSLVDALATGFLRAKPAERLVLLVAVQMKMLLGQPRAAAVPLAKLRAAGGVEWPVARSQILSHEAARRRPREYYDLFQSIGDGPAAYHTLARRFRPLAADPPDAKSAAQTLDDLNAAYAAKYPADPELQLWQAHVQYARGEYAKADETLTAAMAKLNRPATDARTPDPDGDRSREWEWEAYRRLRTNVLFKLGKWKQAYAELPPAGDTFDQLAGRLDAVGDEFALGELVELRAKTWPADPELTFWRGEVQFLKRDYAAALKHFAEVVGRLADRQLPPDYRADERLVRTYLRLNRPQDARAVINNMERPDGHGFEPFLRALAAVVGGDPDGVLDALDQAPHLADRLYNDPDAAALRTGPAFAPVRQKYPPPVR